MMMICVCVQCERECVNAGGVRREWRRAGEGLGVGVPHSQLPPPSDSRMEKVRSGGRCESSSARSLACASWYLCSRALLAAWCAASSWTLDVCRTDTSRSRIRWRISARRFMTFGSGCAGRTASLRIIVTNSALASARVRDESLGKGQTIVKPGGDLARRTRLGRGCKWAPGMRLHEEVEARAGWREASRSTSLIHR
jgi:hypothetical protein